MEPHGLQLERLPSTDEAPYTGVAQTPPCESCRWWAHPCVTTAGVPGRFGECRKKAPKLLLNPALGLASRHWPITGALDGCGDHEPKAPPPRGSGPA